MQSKLVSVIIPVFNCENYILQCVNSVLSQTYVNLEIIIVNDGSTDSTLQLLRTIQDKRVTVLDGPNNGCSFAKNIGLNYANGDYIQYLDADDLLSLDKIECQVNVLSNNSNSIAVCKTVIIQKELDQQFGEIDTELIIKGGSGKDFLLRLLGSEGKCGMVQPNAYLITKETAEKVGEWNVGISPSPDEDGEYFARALLSVDRVIFTNGINYYRKLTDEKSLSQIYSLQRAKNLLRTVEIKFQNIFEVENSTLTNELYQLNISQIAYQFGLEYPTIIDDAINILKKKYSKKLKILYPLNFRIASFFLGFKNTFRLKRLINALVYFT